MFKGGLGREAHNGERKLSSLGAALIAGKFSALVGLVEQIPVICLTLSLPDDSKCERGLIDGLV